jgi:hypothetical protein
MLHAKVLMAMLHIGYDFRGSRPVERKRKYYFFIENNTWHTAIFI